MNDDAHLLPCWRWFGPRDPIPLAHVAQAGASGIVTALHEAPIGPAWTVEAIEARRALITDAGLGLRWAVVESLPVSEAIRSGGAAAAAHIEAYKTSLFNLARVGVTTVCYNFMPVVDWTRTDLAHPLPGAGGALALRFDAIEMAVFDRFILQRPGAEADHSDAVLASAERLYAQMDTAARDRLSRTVLAGLPGTDVGYTLDDVRRAIEAYGGVDHAGQRQRLVDFLAEVAPVAEAAGIRLAVHPDDPPFALFGLPRVVSTAADLAALFAAVPSPANGLTLCAGSLASRADNDVVAIAERFADRIHFAHLRNITLDDAHGSFVEDAHLAGRVDMTGLLRVLLGEQRRRQAAGDAHWRIPMRPDHGWLMLDDLGKMAHNPGYSALGRLRGLAELRGVMHVLAA